MHILITYPSFVVLLSATSVLCTVAEVLVPLASGIQAGLSVEGPSAFRVRLGQPRRQGPAPEILPDKADAESWQVETDRGRGIATSLGSIIVSTDSRLLLLDPSGSTIAETRPISVNGTLSFSSRGGKVYGGGSGLEDGLELSSRRVIPTVTNLATYVACYHSPSDGYSAFGISDRNGPGLNNGGPSHTDPAAHMHVMYEAAEENITWWFRGALELYLMPAQTLEAGVSSYYSLIGAPRLLPRYAFGFIASRWGWRSRDDIEQVLSTFRSQSFPIDAFIVDFEFFTTFNDYSLGAEGSSLYTDFGFNTVTFPSPEAQLAHYKNAFHVRMGGIRKPRLGNDALLDLAKKNGYLMDSTRLRGPDNILQRWLNFSEPATRGWYEDSLSHYLEQGVDFWWNDEGEADYYTFYWWNVAERDLQQRLNRTQRFFSLNRAWTPGMSRLGAAVWTGDTAHLWEHLERTPGTMLKWALSGAPYVACDIGGFMPTLTEDPNLVVRWYQVGIFMPLMRVHSMDIAKPRFPWLWGERQAVLFRRAMNMRYQLLPYHYSLAHLMYRTGKLWTQPLVMAFPHDTNVSSMTSQWMDGNLLVAPVLTRDSRRDVYLPDGDWYNFNSTILTSGPTRLTGAADLGEVPVFARPGTVVPLAPTIQHSAALPGGPLEVQVYGGEDGDFDLVEDDGESVAYESGALRTTHLQWDNTQRRLSWAVAGSSDVGPQAFRELFVRLIEQSGIQTSAVHVLGESGSVGFPPEPSASLLSARRVARRHLAQ